MDSRHIYEREDYRSRGTAPNEPLEYDLDLLKPFEVYKYAGSALIIALISFTIQTVTFRIQSCDAY